MKSHIKLSEVIKEYFQVLLIFLIVSVIVYSFVGQLFEVTGDSMLPNYHGGEQLVAEKISINMTHINRGDVVIFKNTFENGRLLIKRVIGMPEEKFQLKNGYVYINDEKLNESYLSEGTLTYGLKKIENNVEYDIPQNSYVVLGDNRDKSTDSRQWGFVEKDSIVGKAIFIYYPFKNIRLIKGIDY